MVAWNNERFLRCNFFPVQSGGAGLEIASGTEKGPSKHASNWMDNSDFDGFPLYANDGMASSQQENPKSFLGPTLDLESWWCVDKL